MNLVTFSSSNSDNFQWASSDHSFYFPVKQENNFIISIFEAKRERLPLGSLQHQDTN